MKKLIIQILLAGLIIFLGYQCYKSIDTPLKFTEIKKQRYDKTIQRLKDIRTAQEAFKSVYGRYTASFDTLINFVKYDSVKVVRSIGSLTDEQIEAGMTEAQAIKEGLILRDTTKVNTLTSLKNASKEKREDFLLDYSIDDIRYVPFTKRQRQFQMGTNVIYTDSGIEVPVFEARVSNMIIFENLPEEYHEYVLQDNGEAKRLNKYPGLKVGDLQEANNNVGNWQ